MTLVSLKTSTSFGAQQAGQVEDAAIFHPLAVDQQHPRAIARPGGPKRDILFGKGEVEQVHFHGPAPTDLRSAGKGSAAERRADDLGRLGRRFARRDLVDEVHSRHDAPEHGIFVVEQMRGTNMM